MFMKTRVALAGRLLLNGDSNELDVVLDDGEPTPVQPTPRGRVRAIYREAECPA
jgi:hypothetical protein